MKHSLALPGDLIPSVRELARELTINPNTVARAYRQLQDDRVLATVRGTVVRYDPDLIGWMLVSDAFVGAAGHNTIGEVLAAGANAILVPRHLR
jgi:DNA-binding transcriptional regulator YhcF (GntR family)